ncbi:MAG: hypothetical protein GQ574_26350 [Crocinitomix sp.]|nr:hypothetical protein [Crocinitomix sp.]
MEKEELNRIIALLESSNSTEDAYLAIYADHDPYDGYAKANKEGLELFAAQLLKASIDCDKDLTDEKPNIIKLEYEKWMAGELFIVAIEQVDKNKIETKQVSDENTFLGNVFGVGCLGIVIFGFISAIVGAVSIFKWIF